jgi:nicotinate-nucleotide--dimethylbenzimidazole phosphoribosyltransferase
VIVVDGFIASGGGAGGQALQPHVLQRCVFAHCSAEAGPPAAAASTWGSTPLLDLELRLGEGSGAALAWPLLVSACACCARWPASRRPACRARTPEAPDSQH